MIGGANPQLAQIQQQLSLDKTMQARVMSNPAYSGGMGIGSNFSLGTLGGVGLDTLRGLGVTGIGGAGTMGGASDIDTLLAQTNDIYQLGLGMSPEGSLARQLANKAQALSVQNTQSKVGQLLQVGQQLQQKIRVSQQLGLPISQQDQAAYLQINQELAKVLQEQQKFQSLLGTPSSGAFGGDTLGLGSLGVGFTGNMGGAPSAGLSPFMGSGSVGGFGNFPMNAGILTNSGLTSTAGAMAPSVFGGYGKYPVFSQPMMQAPVMQQPVAQQPFAQQILGQQPAFRVVGQPIAGPMFAIHPVK